MGAGEKWTHPKPLSITQLSDHDPFTHSIIIAFGSLDFFIYSRNIRSRHEYASRYLVNGQAPVCTYRRKRERYTLAFGSCNLLLPQRRVSTLLRTPYTQTSVFFPIPRPGLMIIKPIFSYVSSPSLSYILLLFYSTLINDGFRGSPKDGAPWLKSESSSVDKQFFTRG